ncbi:TIGR03086 family metal-binding protein [Streptomyces indicus]|uniref:TIGR03086 family protein n=1 Tax=Streptomyces indicus TaxID=417292 RepID=A0A1G9AM85_9ACTN|nr:TIGR03086 family metal-binding protein [Streptomyces indicus]SDK28442.1 TIGR03086 family protein [Streptomyces indicus]
MSHPRAGSVIDRVELDRVAATETLRIVRGLDDKDWDRPTPCTDWTVRDLLAHMTSLNHGFAAAARGEGGLPAHWRVPAEFGADPVAAYGASVGALIVPFAEHGGGEREFVLPTLGGAFPARVAVAFHLLDLAVHAWDLAVALGARPRLPGSVWDAVLRTARRVPAEGRAPHFAPPVPPAPDTGTGSDPLTATLQLLGRDPHWSPDDQEPPRSL